VKLNKKIDINLGYKCNVRCKFCYYNPVLVAGREFFDIGKIKKQLLAARGLGIEGIDFTGGEPTVSRELIPVVEYARSLGFKTLCLITNGTLLADMDFLRPIKEAGINDILFSIHGDGPGSHDELVGMKGAFEKCRKAIENARELGIRIRINSVITKLNYAVLPGTARVIAGASPEVVSLINLNPCVCKEIYNRELVPLLSEAAPLAKDAIDIIKGTSQVNIMYIPLCLMKGYEKYVHNMHQIQYDPEEWDYLSREIVRRGYVNTLRFAFLRGAFSLSLADLAPANLPEFFHRSMIKALCAKNNVMPENCRACRYYHICDGPWRDYVSLYGSGEFVPVQGDRIYAPDIFMSEG